MATPATASPDKLTRRQAQAKEDADKDRGGGAVPLLLLLAGAAGLGLYELLKGKPATTLTCPAGYTLTNGQCVANTPPGHTLPVGWPANFCSMSAMDQQIGIVWWRLLGRFPEASYAAEELAYSGGRPELGSGLNAVAQSITNAPQGEFDLDVANEVNNPPGPVPPLWGQATYEDKIIAVVFQRFLQRWPNEDWGTGTWQAWINITSGSGIPALARVFAASQEFADGVPAQAAAAVAAYC